MKDATGELSMTAVAVVAIAAIGIVFTTLIWPQIKANITRSTYCSQTFKCADPTDKSTTVDCYYCVDDACKSTGTVKCPAKGQKATS